MVKNRQKSQLPVGVSNNRPIIAKNREKYAKIFVQKSVDMGLILEKICMGGWVFPFQVCTPRHFSGQVPPGLFYIGVQCIRARKPFVYLRTKSYFALLVGARSNLRILTPRPKQTYFPQ